jgi:CRP-like cAMP-binding protein
VGRSGHVSCPHGTGTIEGASTRRLTPMDQKLAMLHKVPLFAGLKQRELEEIGRLCDEVDMAAGHVMTREGAAGNEFFVIVDGQVRVERGGTLKATLGPGQFFGEIALVDHSPRTATVTCDTDCRLLLLGHHEFHSLMDSRPEIRLVVLESLARRLREVSPDIID